MAGIHRLFAHAQELSSGRVVIAIAGMEGTLARVIGGLVSCPVIAVPTSVGYGASFEGAHGSAGYAQLVRERRFGGQHRQRLLVPLIRRAFINHLELRDDAALDV